MSIFEDLANTKLGDVEAPKVIPAGHYVAQISGMWKEHKAKSGNTAARFPFRLQAPHDDVDAADLEAAGGLPAKDFFIDFWMSPDALYRFREFAEGQGVGAETGLVDALTEVATNGVPFLIEGKHDSSDDGKRTFMRWDNPTKLP